MFDIASPPLTSATHLCPLHVNLQHLETHGPMFDMASPSLTCPITCIPLVHLQYLESNGPMFDMAFIGHLPQALQVWEGAKSEDGTQL